MSASALANRLELKIPPLALVVLALALTCTLGVFTPQVEGLDAARWTVGGVLLVAAAVTGVSGIRAFRRAQTTVNPLRPERASTLVTTGVYGFTRNPMYLAMELGLLAAGVFTGGPAALLGPALLAGILTRLQIVPEERALAANFGPAYVEYRARVRRWI